MNKQSVYKFVIAYPDTNDGPYKAAFGAYNYPDSNARFVCIFRNSLLGRILLRLCCTERWEIPFKRSLVAWINKRIFKVIKNTFLQIPGDGIQCLIINQYMCSPVQNGILEMLKAEFPELKIIYYFSDLVQINRERIKICSNKEEFQADAIITYDQNDAEKYDLFYYPLPYSASYIVDGSVSKDCDVCFIGRAKGRYPEILKVYDELTERGIKCDFTVVTERVKLTERRPGIHYQRHQMPYRQYLEIEKKSRCILEIIQEGSCGYTTRIPEAVFLSKRIISDNMKLKENSFFDPNNMLVFEKTGQITDSFVKNDQEASYSHEFKESFQPERFLDFVAAILNEKNNSEEG